MKRMELFSLKCKYHAPTLSLVALLLIYSLFNSSYVEGKENPPPYIEQGRSGDIKSWHTPEFEANWGLGANGFDAAYAAGATGQGVNVGVLDSGTYAKHFDFSTLNNVLNLPAPFLDGDIPDYQDGIEGHGTHVAGIIAANRNGVGMHGGAFNSTLYIGRAFHGELENSAAADAIIDQGITALSNSWGYDFEKKQYRHLMEVDIDNKKHLAGYGPDINDVIPENAFIKNRFEEPDSEFSQLAKLATHGTVVVFAAGNDRYYSASYEYDRNNFRPRMFRGIHTTYAHNMLPRFLKDEPKKFQAVEKNFLNVVMLNRDNTMSHYSDICGTTKYYCVGAAGGSMEGPLNSYSVDVPKVPDGVNVTTYVPGPGKDYITTNVQNTQIPSDYYRIFSTGVETTTPTADGETQQKNLAANYAMMLGTSMAAPTATAGIAVIKSRFPYLTNSQVRDTLLSTAKDQGAPGIDRVFGWGSMDLAKAMGGPAKFWALKAEYDTQLTEIEKRAAAHYNPLVAKADYYGDLAYTTYNDAKELRDAGDLAGAAVKEAEAKGYADKAYSLELTQFHPNEIGDTQEAAFEYYDFRVNLPGIRIPGHCDSDRCIADIWSNDIDGPGGLTKSGAGQLTLNGHNTYKGPTTINDGTMTINGSLTSAVIVNNGGNLGGDGRVGSIVANEGATVSPGNSIGTLNADGDVSFASGSTYAVDVGDNNTSDRLLVAGRTTIYGGVINVSLEHSPTLLSQKEAVSLLGNHYSILRANGGIDGQFESISPASYLFLGITPIYSTNDLSLDVVRNDTSFTSVAQTQNERAVAIAADSLTKGNPVYESILNSDTEGEARQAFRQLSGQIHADIASALINDSRYLREALNGRLRQAEGLASSSAIKAGEGGAWAQLLGAWGHASGDASATGYQASTYGVLVGLDSAPATNWRLGVATGYTRTSLHGGYSAQADSDNYHLAAYGTKQFGPFALRGGAGYSWHRLDTKRLVSYGMQSDRDTAKYSARTEHLFAEGGYSLKGEWLNLEPFVNLAHVNVKNNGIKEYGGASALRGNKQHTNATVSTLGLRADTEWQVSKGTTVALRSEMGWQHQYGELEQGVGLKFKGGNSPFVVNSVPISRDGMVLKIGAEAVVNDNTTLSLGYSGLLSQNHQDNSINAGFTWHF